MKTTRTARLLLAIPAAALAFSLAACAGGPGGGRPSAQEVADGFKKIAEAQGTDLGGGLAGDIADKLFECIGEKFVESDASDSDLQAIVDGKAEDVSANTKLAEIGTSAAQTCATEALGG